MTRKRRPEPRRLASYFVPMRLIHGRPHDDKMAWDHLMGRKRKDIPVRLVTEGQDKPEIIRAWVFIFLFVVSISIAIWAVWRSSP